MCVRVCLWLVVVLSPSPITVSFSEAMLGVYVGEMDSIPSIRVLAGVRTSPCSNKQQAVEGNGNRKEDRL